MHSPSVTSAETVCEDQTAHPEREKISRSSTHTQQKKKGEDEYATGGK